MENKDLSTYILILGAMLFFLQGDNYAAAPVLVDLAKEFGLSPGKAALTVTSYMIPFGLFTLLFGPLGDRFGKANILKSTALLTGICSLVSAFMPSFELVCLVRIFNGIFGAGVMPVSMALIGETAGNDKSTLQAALAKAMGLMFLGGAVGPAIGGWLSHMGSWRFVYGFYGTVELVLAAVIYFKIPVQPTSTQKLNFISAYRKALSRPGINKTVPIMFFVGMAVLGFFPFTGNYIEKVSSLSLSSIGLVLTLFGFGAVVGGRFAQKIFSKVGDFYFPLTGLLGSLFLILISVNPKLPTIALGLAGYGFTFMMLHPMLVARAQQAFPEGRGTVMSLASLNMALGGGFGTFFNGVLLQYWGLSSIFWTSAALFLAASLLAWITSIHLRRAL